MLERLESIYARDVNELVRQNKWTLRIDCGDLNNRLEVLIEQFNGAVYVRPVAASLDIV